MKIRTILFVLSALCLTMSCSKDNPQNDPKEVSYDGYFECRGMHYETLQAAVDACVASGEFPEITLVGNVKDDGVVIPDGNGNCFILDLSAFKYVLNEGKCLNIGNNDAVLSGSGGGIEGNGVIIKSNGEDLSFADNIIIRGDISASSDVCFEENFLGKFEGNLSLAKGVAYFGSEYADVHINNLSITGSNASVQVYDAPKGGILIDNVTSDLKHPVCAMKEGLVKIQSGAAVHVHKFNKSNEVEGDCCIRSHYMMSCPDCGYEYEEFTEDKDAYGPCSPKTLEYEAAKPATATEFGNVERWICPFCDKAYADKDGKTLLENNGLLLPTGLLLDYDVLNYYNTEMNQQNFAFDPITAFGIISSLVSIFIGIPSLIPSPNWADLNAKLDEMNRKLNEINAKLDVVIDLLKAQQAFNKVNERYLQINALAPLTISTFNNITRILTTGSSKTEQEKIKEIKDNVEFWHNQEGGQGIGKFGPLSRQLLSQYSNAALFGGGTVPRMYEIASNTAFLWEHDSYDFRKMLNYKDMMITCCSAILELIYISDIEQYSQPYLRDDAVRIFKSYFEPFGIELKKDLARMDSRKDKVRRLNASFNIDFSNEIVRTRPFLWFAEKWRNYTKCRLPRYTQYADVSKKTCNAAKNEEMFGLPFTVDMAKKIYAYYSREGKKNLDFKNVMVDSARFSLPKWVPSNYYVDRSYFIADNKEENFGHFENDVQYPYYNIFYWRSKKLAGTESWVGFRSCLDKQANPIQIEFVHHCGIKSNWSGHFQWFGKSYGEEFYSLKRADN